MTSLLTQSMLHDPENGVIGDCWRTAIACLLDLDDPLEVPHFVEDCFDEPGDEWFKASAAFVKEHTGGLDLLNYSPTFPIYERAPHPPCVLATGPSPRGAFSHVVLADADTGEIVWDPHPSRDGLAGPIESIAVLT